MTNLQENRLRMYLAERDYCIPNATITENLPTFNENLTILKDTIDLIQAVAEQQKINKTGGTVGKKQLAASLIALAADNARKLTAYAKFTNNPTLLGEVHITEGSFKNLSDTALKDYAQIIYDRAQTNVTALASYGITPTSQTAFLNAINAYNSVLAAPRVNTTISTQATKQLVVLFEKADAALGNMDAAVEIIRLTQPNFYNGYRTARKVINTGTGSLILRARVTDAQTGEALANVTFTLTPVNTGLKAATNSTQNSIVKKTSDGGGLNIKSMPDGLYTVTAQKPGFKDYTENVSVVNGELTVIEVALEKI